MSKELTEKSKFLSFVLRHKPEKVGIKLDREGWADVDELLIAMKTVSRSELEDIVATDAKGRYTIQNNRIRANQGHSTNQVRLSFNKAIPPIQLYHGASAESLPEIFKHGLKPMTRHYVHLSHDLATAQSVGGRRRKGYAVLSINAKQMVTDGITFYLSDNGVWLVDAVPPQYISKDTT